MSVNQSELDKEVKTSVTVNGQELYMLKKALQLLAKRDYSDKRLPPLLEKIDKSEKRLLKRFKKLGQAQ